MTIIYVDDPRTRSDDWIKDVRRIVKHGGSSHDQKDHGNWALYRGIHGDTPEITAERAAASMAGRMSEGLDGTGIYLTNAIGVALSYASHANGVVLRARLKPSAKVLKFNDWVNIGMPERPGYDPRSAGLLPADYAAANGYDAYEGFSNNLVVVNPDVVEWDPEVHDWSDGYDIVNKHYGPGPHANGSPQSVHGGGGGTGLLSRPAPGMSREEFRAAIKRAFGSDVDALVWANHPIPFTDDQLQILASVFNAPLTDRFEMRMNNTSIEVESDHGEVKMVISSNVYDTFNEEAVGGVTRTFRGKEVYHDYFGITPALQHMGIGKALTMKAEDAYRQAGFERIKLEAGLSVGGYAWARAGYQFARSANRGMFHPLNRVRDANSSFASGAMHSFNRNYRRARNTDGSLGDIEVGTWDSVNHKQVWNKAADGADWDALSVAIGRGTATPQDIAVIGQDVFSYDEGSNKHWLGKDILLGSQWLGVKDLNIAANPANIRKMATATWLDETFPARFPGETEHEYIVRLARTAPDDVYDTPVGTTVTKHYGPGPHRNGSPQTVHGGGGVSVEDRIGAVLDSYIAEHRPAAVARLQQSFSKAHVIIGENFDTDIVAGITDGLTKMAEQFPEAADDVLVIRLDDYDAELDGSDARTEWVKTRPRGGGDIISGFGLIFNGAEMNPDVFQDYAEESRMRGETVTVGSIDNTTDYGKAVAIHEFGHVIHNRAIMAVTGATMYHSDGSRNEDLWFEHFGWDQRLGEDLAGSMFQATNYPGTPAAEWHAALDRLRMPFIDLGYSPGDFSSTPAGGISTYATSNRAELVAETFTMRHGPVSDNDPMILKPVLDERLDRIVADMEQHSR